MTGRQKTDLFLRVLFLYGCVCLFAIPADAGAVRAQETVLPPLWAVPRTLVHADAV